MKVPCSYEKCGERRVHWCQPFEQRGTQMVEVPDDHKGPAYCSMTCAILAGAMKLNDSKHNGPQAEQTGK